MVTVGNIYEMLAEYADPTMKMDFDNVGLLVGKSSAQVTKVLTALDITLEVIDEAAALGAQLIVSHHPMFFSLKNVTDTDKNGCKAVKLIENGISGICMHTNLDAAKGGVNDALANALGLKNITLMQTDGIDGNGQPFSYGRVGTLEKPMTMQQFLPFVKQTLKSNGLRFHDAGRKVEKVCSVGGSGGSELEAALKNGCDTFVTADVKYDVFLDAKYYGINLIDADHFCTENTVVPVLKDVISRAFPNLDVIISKSHGQTAQFFLMNYKTEA
jgi:dinuclear metal center YbgI/SA1388 family protein